MAENQAADHPLAPGRSPDGTYWWDGSVWWPVASNGLYYWDGVAWRVIPTSSTELLRGLLAAARWSAFMLTILAVLAVVAFVLGAQATHR